MTPTQRAVINAVAAVEKEVRARAHTPKLRFEVFSTTDKVLAPTLSPQHFAKCDDAHDDAHDDDHDVEHDSKWS